MEHIDTQDLWLKFLEFADVIRVGVSRLSLALTTFRGRTLFDRAAFIKWCVRFQMINGVIVSSIEHLIAIVEDRQRHVTRADAFRYWCNANMWGEAVDDVDAMDLYDTFVSTIVLWRATDAKLWCSMMVLCHVLDIVRCERQSYKTDFNVLSAVGDVSRMSLHRGLEMTKMQQTWSSSCRSLRKTRAYIRL